MNVLEEAFALSESGNSEILFEWLRLSVAHRFERAFPTLERFLVDVGRRKFLKPLYQELVKTDWGRHMAERIYATARPRYHFVSSNTIDDLVGVPDGQN